jgi:hypothetical protein
MKAKKNYSLLAFVILMGIATAGWAGDTSPYLIGAWEDDGQTTYTDFIVINPTATRLDVYAAFFTNNGAFIPGKCFKKSINSSAQWYLRGLELRLAESDLVGTAKFVAVPAGTRTLNSSAFIAGFQNRWIYEMTSSQADLKGVTINISTPAELAKILSYGCTNWEEPN